MNLDFAELGQHLLPLAARAAAAIRVVYDSDFAVSEKSDRSPLTAADLASHHVLMDGLAALTPDIPVLSEESAERPAAERHAWSRFWCVDPLDGTREFLKRNGEFCICIALIDRGAPVLGLLQAPISGLTYFAAQGIGAWRLTDGQRERIHAVPMPGVWRVAGSRSHGDVRTAATLARLGEHEFRPMGSALKFGLVAEGAADLYLRFGPTSEWDTAAGQCLVEQAGGCVLDLHGEALRYNQREGLLNPDFLVLADRSPQQIARVLAAVQA